MNNANSFAGFPAAGFQFLADLAANNNKTWFDAHQEEYRHNLLAPSVAFVEAIGARLQTIVPEIHVNTRTNGSGTLMRIYRDTRFSQDKTPYKTAVSGLYWQGDGKKTECPAFGFHVDEKGMRLMAGLFVFSKAQLPRYRQAVVDDTWGNRLAAAVTAVRQSGNYQLQGQHFKKMPAGYDAPPERSEWLLYNALYIHPQHSIPLTEVCSPAIVDICLNHFRNMAPIQQWLAEVLG